MSEVTINIKSSGDKKDTVTIDPSSTILQLKEKIFAQTDVPVERQRLIYSGKVLKDGDTISTYKIENGHTLHLVKGAAPKSESTPAAATAIGSGNSGASADSSATSAAASVPQNIAAGQGAYNPFAALTGARYAGANIPMPSADMFGPDGGMGALPDPERMDEMMSSPMFQEAMNNLISDPQMLDFMIQQSPQLRAMGPQARQLLQSDMFRNMMRNPEYLRSAMQMQRNFGGMPGGSATSAFPAPGNANDSTEGDASTATSNTEGTAPAASNPFAALLGAGNPFANFGAPGSTGAAGSGAVPNFGDLFGLGSQFGAPGTTAAPAPVDNRPPEEVYESQLRQLNDMGFFDFDRNVRALRRSGGSVQGAIEALLSEF